MRDELGLVSGQGGLSRRRVWWEWLLLAALAALSALVVGYVVWSERRLMIASDVERMRAQTLIIDENLRHQFEGVRNALDSARSAFRPGGVCNEGCRRVLLQSLKRAMPGVRALVVVDRDGRILQSDDDLRDARLDDHNFTRNIARMRSADTLYLSQPYENTPGVFNLKLSRAIVGADGRNAGAVSAILNPDYFDAVMRSALYVPDMNSAITEDSGRRILYVPADPAALRAAALADPFFRRHRQSGQALTVMRGAAPDGEARLAVQRTMLLPELDLDKTLVVSLSRSQARIDAGWHALAWSCGLAWLLTGAVTSAGLWLVQRRRLAHESLARARDAEIIQLAFYDSLTKLPSRRLLLDRLGHAVAKCERATHHCAVLFVDLDNFKALNDSMGHDMGDRLLEGVAARLQQVTRDSDTVARLGGDEFVILLEDLGASPAQARAQAEVVAQKIVGALGMGYPVDGHQLRTTPSIGVVLFGGGRHSINDLLRQADMAMYEAKAAGRNTYRLFDPRMQEALDETASLDADLRQALARDELALHYQPVVDAAGRMTGVEGLLRWRHARRGQVAPAEFIAQAEKSSLIIEIGDWVLATACRQLVRWAATPRMAALTVAVNVSARQFHQAGFGERVLAIVERSGANPALLTLELTESVLLADMDDVIGKMTLLKARGIGFALDDFGTGYSSLSYLQRLPIDQLKIERSFVHDMLATPHAGTIVRSIVSLAHSMGLAVVAEGVENRAQWELLRQIGCSSLQGYLFGRAVAAAELPAADAPLGVAGLTLAASAVARPPRGGGVAAPTAAGPSVDIF